MQFSITTVLAFTGLAVALPSNPLFSRDNTCFDGKTPACLRFEIETSLANQAITSVCSQVPTCVSGTTYTAVQGKIPGYTATLTLGNQCAGVTEWSLDACTQLFWDVLDAACGHTDGVFHTGYVRSACDDTFVSFNLGG
ncbi:hypothetical protein P280DRAFT_508866 [Massarina eburnea CBS 473.64]|uniref:Uncharacterized protein n=1 Tax=Massarina eburnea CBS 473.64 TaxID=1395130 RepID=A0A6A6RTT9_9PLEO|nr:hypothetical protein P280DRAFT_508866 [Massarina eburnea CBS 473.64]